MNATPARPAVPRRPGLLDRAAGVLLALAGACDVAAAADAMPDVAGTPILRRYGADDYPAMPKHLAVLADPRGRVFVGNVEGLLTFEAGAFELVRLPHESQVRSLALDEAGQLLIGGYDHFGVLEEDATGTARFVDYVPRFGLSPDERFVGEVWTIVSMPGATYFQTVDRVYVLRDDGTTAVLDPEPEVRSLYRVRDRLYARLKDVGLTRLEGDAFVPIPGGDRFKDKSVYSLTPRTDGTLLAMTRADGFFVLDSTGARPLPTSSDALFRELELYALLELADGTLAVGTLNGEILRLDATMRLLNRYPVSTYPILALSADREGGLWAATQGDLVRVMVPSPWTVFSEADGLRGSLSDALWFDGARWVASTSGLFRSRAGKDGRLVFEKLPWTKNEAWDLQVTSHGLLFAERDAVYHVVDGQPKEVLRVLYPWWFFPSRFRADHVFVVYEPGVQLLGWQDGAFRPLAKFEPADLSTEAVTEISPTEIWLGNYRGGPVRLTLSEDGAHIVEDRRFGPGDGLPVAPDAVSHTFTLDGKLYVGIDDGVYAWNGTRFAPSTVEGLAAEVSRPTELQIREAPDGRRYAFTSRELVSRAPGDTRWRPVRVDSPLARGFTEVNVEPDGTLSVVAWSALLTFDPRAATARPATLETLVHRAAVRDADGVSTLLDRRGLAPVDLPPHRALVIEVGVNTADPGVQFRSRLVGIDDAYSPWSAVGRREFLALPPGDYVFEAEARTASGRVAKPARLPFRVAPRWYQETWVRAALALALLAITFALSRWYSLVRVRRIEAQNRNLEALIADRTRELERANRQLARLATLDGLTAVPNRRGFDSFLDEHWTQCRERGEPLSLLMIDVDHFKQYNDRHGHLAGDEALRAIAAELARFASGEDEILARFGGEEFAMVLAGQPIERAVDRAQYIRQHFEERANERNGLTLSIGVACAVPQVGHAPRQLIDEADAALYQAKRKGRNRVETQRALSA